MGYQANQPLIIQSDRTILLEVCHPEFEEVRDKLSAFAELVKSPEHIHTYRMTPLSLWNAAASGVEAAEILRFLRERSKFDLPDSLCKEMDEIISRYGRIELIREEGMLVLRCTDPILLDELGRSSGLKAWLQKGRNGCRRIAPEVRGLVKQELMKLGWPVRDLAGYSEGETLPIRLREQTYSGETFRLRNYQRQAAEAFYRRGSNHGGNGVLVLPCGAGKTVVGLAVMARVGRAALILTPNTTSVRQWVREILDKTELTEDQVGEYTGERKQVKPVTVATYQILTHRGGRGEFPHLDLFSRRDWGLIIYDEVHLLPAPVFRATADLQAKRRLGLTATLVREDGREEDVFSLIGPKKVDVPWKELEKEQWIAQAACTEVRTPMDQERRREYADAKQKQKYRIAAENPNKILVLENILKRHKGEKVLVIGQYLHQLEEIAARLQVPLLTGKTQQRKREELYDAFRRGEVPVLVVSKVANFAVDLPDARVAVQISGTFGSRQEEAQRLGRILRPKAGENKAHFYNLVSRDTVDQEYALNRQLFLVEQGYRYTIMDAEQWEEVE
ncbi:DNA repair helicase XPB [Salinithrix halophila]|uniref:DNA 3'-5' helicase n=1 Tax=Salinithrix halophila TaxID=1485204 RepID=A0ABV8JEZ2_9BACL